MAAEEGDRGGVGCGGGSGVCGGVGGDKQQPHFAELLLILFTRFRPNS